MPEIEVLAALDGPYEAMEKLILRAGLEDSSGFRRSVLNHLAHSDWGKVASNLECTEEEAKSLQAVFVEAWGPIPEDCAS